jgi:hypothetical protein
MITERKFTRKEYYVAFMNERSFGVSPFIKPPLQAFVHYRTVLVNFKFLLRSVAEPYPGSGDFFDPRIRISNPDPGSGMNIPDDIYESLETIFCGRNT